MSDDKLKEIINDLTSESTTKYFNSDDLYERNKHLANEDGKIDSNAMALMVLNESISYTRNFAYDLLKKLQDEGYLVNPKD